VVAKPLRRIKASISRSSRAFRFSFSPPVIKSPKTPTRIPQIICSIEGSGVGRATPQDLVVSSAYRYNNEGQFPMVGVSVCREAGLIAKGEWY